MTLEQPGMKLPFALPTGMRRRSHKPSLNRSQGMTLRQPGMKLPFALPKECEDAATSLPLTEVRGDTQADLE
jgi:hypothetical protein